MRPPGGGDLQEIIQVERHLNRHVPEAAGRADGNEGCAEIDRRRSRRVREDGRRLPTPAVERVEELETVRVLDRLPPHLHPGAEDMPRGLASRLEPDAVDARA